MRWKILSRSKKSSRLDAAIQSYRAGEVTLGRAAELAGIHRYEFEEVLRTQGIVKEVEVDSVKELDAGISNIKSLHTSNERPERV